MEQKRSAIVLGATGAVGSSVVRALLKSSRIEKVTTLGRNPFRLEGAADPRLDHKQVDVFDPASYETFVSGHQIAFCTLGIGQPSKVSREELHKVDVEAAGLFAEACKRRGVEHFSLLTAVGADPKSRVYYLRFKGEIEDKVRTLGFARASFFRPSMLMTRENRYGLSQGLLLKIYPALDRILVGPLRNLRSIRVEDLGKAMVKNAEKPGMGVEVLQWSEFAG